MKDSPVCLREFVQLNVVKNIGILYQFSKTRNSNFYGSSERNRGADKFERGGDGGRK